MAIFERPDDQDVLPCVPDEARAEIPLPMPAVTPVDNRRKTVDGERCSCRLNVKFCPD